MSGNGCNFALVIKKQTDYTNKLTEKRILTTKKITVMKKSIFTLAFVAVATVSTSAMPSRNIPHTWFKTTGTISVDKNIGVRNNTLFGGNKTTGCGSMEKTTGCGSLDKTTGTGCIEKTTGFDEML